MVNVFCYLLQFKFCDVVQNLIPYVRQIVFAYVSVQGWIVDPYVCKGHRTITSQNLN